MHAGSILLLHDGDGYDPDGDRMQTAEAVPLIIDGLDGADFASDAARLNRPHEAKPSRDRFASA